MSASQDKEWTQSLEHLLVELRQKHEQLIAAAAASRDRARQAFYEAENHHQTVYKELDHLRAVMDFCCSKGMDPTQARLTMNSSEFGDTLSQLEAASQIIDHAPHPTLSFLRKRAKKSNMTASWIYKLFQR